MDIKYDITNIIPEPFKKYIQGIPDNIFSELNELRFTVNSPVLADLGDKCLFITKNGLSSMCCDSAIITKKAIQSILNLISGSSLYAYDTQLKNGFLTLKGGHRVGISGTVVYDGNKIKTIRDISSLVIRIAKNINSADDSVYKNIVTDAGIKNVLIAGVPKSGKTTLLRSIAKTLSCPNKYNKNQILKVGIIDERMEIASVFNGEPILNVGMSSFVINGANKYDGTEILIRAFSPEVIIMDEIWRDRDITAVKKAINAGSSVICTVHAAKNGIKKFFDLLPVDVIIYTEKEKNKVTNTFFNRN